MSSDALAETATAVPTEPQGPAKDGLPASIGRYQIKSLLGQGGMGVVYAAHDPDLDRRVALKVLRGVGSDPARARLLREARAMAKLSHPSVVTVHEVGSANGVDYVAMELIDGSTVAEWIDREHPAAREVLSAYEAAGRGVACAHEAGLVHRDFKPHNVLRSKGGRIVVTDFGLARATLDVEVAPLAATLPVDKSAGSLSSTLTATGAVLGTPAYMAPEQHDGGTVGPAADQFAYCVALWESLAGARPFKGATMAAVRENIERGPDPATEAKIPRRLRGVLRRGLSVDARKRFASMDDLMKALYGGTNRGWRLAGVGAALAGAGALAVVMFGGGGKDTPPPAAPIVLAGCGPAEVELAGIVDAPVRPKLLASDDGKRLLAHLDHFTDEWRAAQTDVCAHRDHPKYAARATCLAAVAADLHRTMTALDRLTPEELVDADPTIGIGDAASCQLDDPPTRIPTYDDASIAMVAAANGDRKRRDAMVEPPADNACQRGVFAMTKLRDYRALPMEQIHKLKEMALAAADQCHDDRFGAGVTCMVISTDIANALHDPAAAARMDAAIGRSGGDRTLKTLEELVHGLRAQRAGDVDGEIKYFLSAAELADVRGARTVVGFLSQIAAGLLEGRGKPGDIDRAAEILRNGIATSVRAARPDAQRQLFRLLIAHGKRDEALAVAKSIAEEPGDGDGFQVVGKLVDERGAPVSGARVLAAKEITFYGDDLDPIAPAHQVAVTGADGTFTIPTALPVAWIVASDGAHRSQAVKAAPRVDLKLRPTAAISGKVTKIGERVGTVEVVVNGAEGAAAGLVDYRPAVGDDGSWKLDHVPVGRAAVLVSYQNGLQVRQVSIDVGGAGASKPVALDAVVAGGPVDVIVRSEVAMALQHAPVWIIHAKTAPKKIGELGDLDGLVQRGSALPMPTDAAAPVVKALLRPGDVVARVMNVEPGPAFVCAYGSAADLNDRAAQDAIEAHRFELTLGCAPITVTGKPQAVVVTVPAAKRFD